MVTFRSKRGRHGKRIAYPIIQRRRISHLSQTQSERYQGWANWDTWATNLWIDNERQLYDRKWAWVLNFGRKMQRGTFNRELAKKAVKQYLIKEAIKFAKQHGEDIDINKVSVDETVDNVLEDANWLVKNEPEKLKIGR